VKILGIETSCDETAIAVVENGHHVLSNVVSSQVDLHAKYGGIVPEVASRQHLLSIIPIFREALSTAGIAHDRLDALSVTTGPGLAGSLLVGVNFAKGAALGLGLPLLEINHLEGHIYANWLDDQQDQTRNFVFPILCLIASGGHTDLILMKEHGDYTLLGKTLDDAAGEAFDKVARLLGLAFPGGPEIQRIAATSNESELLPRAWLGDSLDFSFSGLKTATLNKIKQQTIGNQETTGQENVLPGERMARIAAGFQESIIDVLVSKSLKAAQLHRARGILLGGGVAANSLLRSEMNRRSPLPIFVPAPALCTDNGAMIAAAAYYQGRHKIISGTTSLAQDIIPHLRLGVPGKV